MNETSVVASVDFFPTLCAMAKASPPANVKFDGEDISTALLGPGFTRAKPLLWEYGRNPNWFKFPGAARDRSPNVAIRDGPWKLLVNADGSNPELYNVIADSSETTNRAKTHVIITRKLSEQVLAWRQSVP